MKIAYITYWDVGFESGVLKKISRQIHSWQDAGCEVKLFVFSPSGSYWSVISDLNLEIIQTKRLRNALIKSESLFEKVRAWIPELIYFRFFTYYPGMAKLMISIPTVLEINTNDLSEMKATEPFYLRWYHQMTRERALKNSAGMVFLTEETAACYKHYGKPIKIIGDGINLSDFPQLPAPGNNKPKLAFLASRFAPWHGVDKILWLAEYFKFWQFDLIGNIPADLYLKNQPNVSVHGFLGKNKYESILARADVALGTLALHRIGMSETAPLKIREYLAYGLPTIIGHKDTDFLSKVPFLLVLPNTPKNVSEHVSEIERFVIEWMGRRVPRDLITHVDGAQKEKQRLLFFEQVLEIKHSSTRYY